MKDIHIKLEILENVFQRMICWISFFSCMGKKLKTHVNTIMKFLSKNLSIRQTRFSFPFTYHVDREIFNFINDAQHVFTIITQMEAKKQCN